VFRAGFSPAGILIMAPSLRQHTMPSVPACVCSGGFRRLCNDIPNFWQQVEFWSSLMKAVHVTPVQEASTHLDGRQTVPVPTPSRRRL